VWPDFKEQHVFTRELLARASALPGVRSAAIAGNHPLDPGFTNSFTIVGRESEARSWPEISIRRVTAGYFATVGLQLVSGRLLLDSDTTTSAPVALINAAAVNRFFPDRSPIGARIRFWGTARTVVGIVGDEKFHGVAESSPIAVYTPLSQTPSANGAGVLLLRTAGDAASLSIAATAAIHAIDPGLAVFAVEPLDVTMSRSLGQRRFTMLLLGLLAGVALVLASIGVHGVLSHAVAERHREIGIRMALGARSRDLVSLVVGNGLALTAIGLTLGLAGAAALTRFLRAQLFTVTPTDPTSFCCRCMSPRAEWRWWRLPVRHGEQRRSILSSRFATSNHMFRTTLQDLKHGGRLLMGSPAFTTVAVAALAIGIGANTAIFAVVNTLLIQRLPYKNRSTGDSLGAQSATRPTKQRRFPWELPHWRELNSVFADMSIVRATFRTAYTGDGQPEELAQQIVNATLFPILGVNAAVGRVLTAADDQPQADRVVLVSDRLWKRRFAGDASVINHGIRLDGNLFTIVG
jgi:hypothetical protein